MKEIDAHGLACPRPVMLTQEAIADGEEEIQLKVDNQSACENVARIAEKNGYQVTVDEEEEDKFTLNLVLADKKEEASAREQVKVVYFLRSDTLGRGDDQLGQILTKAFLYTLTEKEHSPSSVVLINSGVKLACENEDAISHFKKLEEKGVEILACGTCLDYFNLKDKVKVGQVSNMYEIVETITQADMTITL